MFEEFYTYLAELKSSIDNILSETIADKANSSIDTIARSALQELLIEIGMDAIDSVDEYNKYEPLKDRFKSMLERGSHVKIENGTVVTAFNEQVAGTFMDLIAGQKAAGGHTGTDTAPYVWKYGIYIPFAQGSQPKGWLAKLDELPSYEQVIDERLAYWATKNIAPYWMLINDGTMSWDDPDRAYPTFGGTYFVQKFRAIAQTVVERAKLIYLQNLAESYGAEVEEITANPKRGSRLTVLRIPVAGGTLTAQESSRGNIFFRIGKRGISFEEAKAIVKRAYK